MAGDSSISKNIEDAGTGADSRYVLANYVITEQQREAQAKAAAAESRSEIGSAAVMFGKSLAYSALQTPLDGVTQLANQVVHPLTGGKDVVPRVEVMASPPPAPVGGLEWTAKLAGGGIGTVLPFWFGGKLAVKMIEPLADVKYIGPAIQRLGVLKDNSVAQLAFKGAVYEGVFHPVDVAADGSMAAARAVNATSGALSFMAMGAANKWMRETGLGKAAAGAKFPGVGVVSDFGIDGVSGAIAGVSDTTIHAFAQGKLPELDALGQSAAEYGVMSVFLRGLRLPIEKAATEPVPGEKKGGKDVIPAEPEPTIEPSPSLKDPLSLRPTLPFDRVGPLRQTIASTGEPAHLIGVQRKTGHNLYFRADAVEPVSPTRMQLNAAELKSMKLQHVQHEGKQYAVAHDGSAYSVMEVSPGVYELVATNKILLERIAEVQVPWPPMQSEEQYKARAVLRLEDLWNWRPASS